MHRSSVLIAKVRDHQHLTRNMSTKAVTTNDKAGLDKYRQERDKTQRFDRVEKKVEQLCSDIDDIKSLLSKLLEKNKA